MPIDPMMAGQMPPMPPPGGNQATPPMPPPMGNQMPMQGMMPPLPMPDMGPQKMYDVKIKRCIKSGQLKVKNLPPEDFLIDPNATDLRDGWAYGDVTRMTRSDAKLKWPDKKSIIDELPAYTPEMETGTEKQARDNRLWAYKESVTDKNTEEIEIFELYLKLDYDGDGVSEWRQVCMGGTVGGRQILSNEECGDDHPYVSITPDPMPHRYRGRSLYDEAGDIQRVKTVLLRQMLDNLYITNNPMLAVNAASVENMDALTNPDVGQIVITNGDPGTVLAPIAVPFVAEKVFPALEYWDMVLEKRTGVSRSTMALDLDTLQHQTATAVNAQQSAAFTKVETYARNIAECGGLKELFSKLLKLFVQNQKSVKHIQVAGKFEPMDPRGWNADMRVTINVGLGAGSRDRDLAMLGGLASKQELVIQTLKDPFNPFTNIGHLFKTYRQMIETGGLKNPEEYFPEITQEMVKQISDQMQQNPQPSPEQQKAQAQMQIEGMKLQAEGQRDERRAQLDNLQFQQKAEIEKTQAQADIATQQQKAQTEAALAERRFQLERELKLLDFRMKMAEKRAEIITKSAQGQKDAMGNPTPIDQDTIQAALNELDGAEDPESAQRRTTAAQQRQMADQQREQALMNTLAGVAQSMQQLAASMSAPTEVVRDPKTGRVIGARKTP